MFCGSDWGFVVGLKGEALVGGFFSGVVGIRVVSGAGLVGEMGLREGISSISWVLVVWEEVAAETDVTACSPARSVELGIGEGDRIVVEVGGIKTGASGLLRGFGGEKGEFSQFSVLDGSYS